MYNHYNLCVKKTISKIVLYIFRWQKNKHLIYVERVLVISNIFIACNTTLKNVNPPVASTLIGRWLN